MRIAFVYPATRVDKKVLPDCLPMGILYLAAVAEKRRGARVDVFDRRQGKAFPDLDGINDYDVLGFTAMTMQATTALRLARKARRAGFSGKIVFGGPHASVAPEDLKKQPDVDAVFVGEAEESFLQYLRYLEGEPHELTRVWVREADGWRYHPGDRFVEDLDSLPFPAREKYGDLPARMHAVNMTTSRGCPYQCRFCQPTKEILFGKKVRRRSTENIIAELEETIRRYGIQRFSIDDDTFTFKKSAVVEFCEAVGPLKLKWSCQSRSDIDRETLTAMRDAGCDLIIVGVESGSQRMLDLMGKKNTVESNKRFIQSCNDLGIGTWCNLMVGYPGETEDDRRKSLEFVRETNPTLTNVSQVTPFPGTYLWEDCQDDIIETRRDHIARHVHKAKFKSLAPSQLRIKNYITLMNKRWQQPVSADLVDLTGPVGRLAWRVPYLLRVLVHTEHVKIAALERVVEMAGKGRTGLALRLLGFFVLFRSTKTGALGNMAWLHLVDGRPEKAVKYYRRLLAVQPENEEARSLLARALRESEE